MRTKSLACLLACATAVTAVAGGDVDREALKRVVDVPNVFDSSWAYKISLDGRAGAVQQQIGDFHISELSAELAGNETDADRWMDLAWTCRHRDDIAQAENAVAKAVAIFRRRCAERPDDGRPLASLGLALIASGDDDGADSAIRSAATSRDAAWAGAAAVADGLVIRAAGHVADRRFATILDVYEWLGQDGAAAKELDAALLDTAARMYDRAVAGLESSGAIGQEASSVYARRWMFRALRSMARGTRQDDSPAGDDRKAAGMQPSEPFAVLLLALDDAMSEPDAEGTRNVQSFEELSDAARTNVAIDLARLRELATSSATAKTARALQAIACIQWFCIRDPAATEASLRRSLGADPRLDKSWDALALVLASAKRGDDLIAVCRDRIAKTGESPRKRLLLANALWLRGNAEAAEKEWRAGLALAPKDALANLGLAAMLIRRAKDDAELTEAAALLKAAKAASAGTKDSSIDAACRIWDAVLLGLTGDVDGAEKLARRLVADFPEEKLPKEVLAAIGR